MRVLGFHSPRVAQNDKAQGCEEYVQNNFVAYLVGLSTQCEIGFALPVSTYCLTNFIALNLLRRAESWSDRNSGSCSLSAYTRC